LLRRSKEAQHIQVSADTGAGKSTTIRTILYQVEARGETAIVFDPEREYLKELSIVPGLPVDTQLQRLVCECDVMFTLINSRWIDELRRRAPQHETGEQIDFVRAELKYALERGDAMPVIPILADTVEHPRGTDLPEDIRALSRRSSAHLSRDKFAEDVLDLFRQVAMHLGKTQPLIFRN
jgi:hypothetical protein